MNVQELITALQKHPSHARVYVSVRGAAYDVTSLAVMEARSETIVWLEIEEMEGE